VISKLDLIEDTIIQNVSESGEYFPAGC